MFPDKRGAFSAEESRFSNCLCHNGLCAKKVPYRLQLKLLLKFTCFLFFKGFPIPTLPACLRALGLGSGKIPDSSMVASSEFDVARKAASGRLHLQDGGGRLGAWTARKLDGFQWLQVNFLNWTSVGRVAIQGRFVVAEWVTSFSLSFGYDGVFFQHYQEGGFKKVI